jgi:hypothetical protein
MVSVEGCFFIDNPGLPPAGTSSASSTSGTGGSPGTTGSGGSGGGDGGPPTTCDRYGGYPTIQAVVNDFLGRLTTDCHVAPYFTALPPSSMAHFGDCLTKQLAVMTHCPGIRYDVDSNGADCLDMKTSHHGLGIRQADYDVFVADLLASLSSAGFSQADRDALKTPLDFYNTDIVTNSAPGLAKSICDAGGGG